MLLDTKKKQGKRTGCRIKDRGIGREQADFDYVWYEVSEISRRKSSWYLYVQRKDNSYVCCCCEKPFHHDMSWTLLSSYAHHGTYGLQYSSNTDLHCIMDNTKAL